jgi:succinate dehydrogenase / fumarate reductase membrane anchor subunit
VKLRFTGLAAWWVQRVSAVYMLLFIVFLLAAFSLYPRHSYSEWRTWVSSPGMTIAVSAFFAALLSHMWVGLRDVLLDYARPASLRRLLLGILAAGLLATAAWVVRILMRLHA